MKEQKIAAINTHFPLATTEKFPLLSQLSFDKDTSLYDYDIFLIDSKIAFPNNSMQRLSNKNGLWLSSEVVFSYKTIFKSMRKQLIDLLEQGKNIYVIMDQF